MDSDVKCAVSGAPLVNSASSNSINAVAGTQKSNVVMFFCGHGFYEEELLKTIGSATGATASTSTSPPTGPKVATLTIRF